MLSWCDSYRSDAILPDDDMCTARDYMMTMLDDVHSILESQSRQKTVSFSHNKHAKNSQEQFLQGFPLCEGSDRKNDNSRSRKVFR